MISKDKPENFKPKFDVVGAFIEHEGEMLMLHRHDSKPQGNTWSVVGGKVDVDEDLADALVREIQEEIGLRVDKCNCKYFDGYYVRYDDYDFKYHIFHVPLDRRHEIKLKIDENKDHIWISPEKALKLDLIQDEDACIKWFYKIN